MKDTNEGGSRDSGSAHQQPAPATAIGSEAETRGVTAPEVASTAPLGETGEEAGLRPVSADMQQFIGRQLRAVFDDVAKQPIPDRFLELMKQLDGKTGAR